MTGIKSARQLSGNQGRLKNATLSAVSRLQIIKFFILRRV